MEYLIMFAILLLLLKELRSDKEKDRP